MDNVDVRLYFRSIQHGKDATMGTKIGPLMAVGLALALTLPALTAISASAQQRNEKKMQENLTKEVRHQLLLLPYYSVFDNLMFKVEGDKLTGTITMGQMGEGPISEGKVDGENVSFAVVREFNGNEFRINYKGKVSGDEMKITGEVVGRDRTFEMTAKRAK